MKGKSKYLMPIVLLLCMVFSSVLFAEHRDTGQDIMSETSTDEHKHEKRDRRRDLWTKDSIHRKHFQENGIANTSSDAWKIETVDGGEVNVGRYSSIAIDFRDKVHISYFDYSSYDLKYATNASGTWVTTIVDSSVSLGNTSIAIDSKDKVHISYYSNHDLKYATNASGSWKTTTADDSGFDEGEYNSIAIDSKNKVHISYDNGSLNYTTNASGTWVTTTVDRGAYRNTSIAIDSRDKVHISYYDYYDEFQAELKYATNAFHSPTPTPSPQPTPTVVATPSVTPTPIITPTPIPSCEPENITADQKTVEVSIESNAQVTITITCEDDTFVEGKKVARKIKKGKKNVSISPKSETTDAHGQAVFTITGVKKGRAKVEFTSGDLKTKVKVKVTE